MILTLLSVAGILYMALQLEDKLKVPSPLGLIGLAFGFEHFFAQSPLFTADPASFALLVLFLLPVLLISDSLELKVSDLKEHGLSLFYLAVVAVALSVITAVFTADLIFAEYHLSLAAVIVLFAMVLATDPVAPGISTKGIYGQEVPKHNEGIRKLAAQEQVLLADLDKPL
ncbi:MAG: hypothetical protein R8L58_04470, partial [Mariprofundaceae bacterium]